MGLLQEVKKIANNVRSEVGVDPICRNCSERRAGCELNEPIKWGGGSIDEFDRLCLDSDGHEIVDACVHFTCEDIGVPLAQYARLSMKDGKGALPYVTSEGVVHGLAFGSEEKPTATPDEMKLVFPKQVSCFDESDPRRYRLARKIAIESSQDPTRAKNHKRIVSTEGVIYSSNSEGVLIRSSKKLGNPLYFTL